MDATVLDASVEAQFHEWDLGVLMLGRIDRCATARSSMHRLAAATLRCFQPNGPGAELSAVLSTAFSLILPIDAILDGDAEPLESGVEPVRAHPHRDVEIEPQRQVEPSRQVAAGPELLVGDPLDEFEIGEPVGFRQSEAIERTRVRPAPFRRPSPPRSVEPAAQKFKGGEARQHGAAPLAE